MLCTVGVYNSSFMSIRSYVRALVQWPHISRTLISFWMFDCVVKQHCVTGVRSTVNREYGF